MSKKKEKPEKTRKQQESNRNPDGTFKEGMSGNPAGRPPGTRNLSTALHEALQQKAKNSANTYQELLIQRVLNDAIVKGKGDMVKLIWSYIDGQPQQGIDLTTGGESMNMTSDRVMDMVAEISARLKEEKT